MCDVLDVPRSMYYQSLNKTISNRERENNKLTKRIIEKWVGEITYMYTLRHGWCYFASVMDLHTKKIVGYSFSCTMKSELIIQAQENAYYTQIQVKV